MYGFNHLPPIQNAISVTEFVGEYGSADVIASEWKAYNIPDGASFLYIVLIGRGGNGGTPSVGAGITGSGGGGAGAITKAILPVLLLPKIIYVKLPSAQSTTSTSRVSIRPTDVVNNDIIASSNGRSGTSVSSGGIAGAVFTSSGSFAGTLALWVSQAGAAGGAGSTTNGAAVTALETLPLTGGGGGGGSSAGTGGNVTGAGPFPTITGGASGENPGRPGYMLRQPFGGVGGSGGGGVNAAGTGLNKGGDGAIGCGGGGGGNAASGTPGAGGQGGPGYCLIVAF